MMLRYYNDYIAAWHDALIHDGSIAKLKDPALFGSNNYA